MNLKFKPGDLIAIKANSQYSIPWKGLIVKIKAIGADKVGDLYVCNFIRPSKHDWVQYSSFIDNDFIIYNEAYKVLYE